MTKNLLTTLIDEQAAIEALASVLALEQKALTSVELDEQLPSLVDKKTELLSTMAALEQSRDAHLAALGLPPGAKGIEQAVVTDPRLAAQWANMKGSAERARRANNTNGVLIRTRMDFNRRALTALQVTPPKAALYGPDGRMPAYSIL